MRSVLIVCASAYVLLSTVLVLYTSWVVAPTGRDFAYPYTFNAALKVCMCAFYAKVYLVARTCHTKTATRIRKTWHGRPLTPAASAISDIEESNEEPLHFYDRAVQPMDAAAMVWMETVPASNTTRCAFPGDEATSFVHAGAASSAVGPPSDESLYSHRECVEMDEPESYSESMMEFGRPVPIRQTGMTRSQVVKSIAYIVALGTVTNLLSIYVYSSTLDLATRQMVDATGPVVTLMIGAWLDATGLRQQHHAKQGRPVLGCGSACRIPIDRIRRVLIALLVIGSLIGVYRPTSPPMVLVILELVTVFTSTVLGFVRQEFLLRSQWSVSVYVLVVTAIDIPLTLAVCLYAYGLDGFQKHVVAEALQWAIICIPAIMLLVIASTQLQKMTSMSTMSILDAAVTAGIVVFDLAYTHSNRTPSAWLLIGLVVTLGALCALALTESIASLPSSDRTKLAHEPAELETFINHAATGAEVSHESL